MPQHCEKCKYTENKDPTTIAGSVFFKFKTPERLLSTNQALELI